MVLQHRVHSGALTELLLAAPQHLVGQPPLEGAAQHPLGGPVGADQFPLRRERQRELDDVEVEERHARLDPVGGGHPVHPLQPADVHPLQGGDQLVVQRLPGLVLDVVGVAGEELVGALPGEHHLDVPAGELGDQMMGHRAVHEAGVEGLELGDDTRHQLDGIARGVHQLVVLGTRLLGHEPGGDQVAAALQADREGRQRLGRVGPQVGGDRGHDAGVQPTGQQHAHRDRGVQTALHRPDDGLAQRVEDPLRRIFLRCAALEQHGRSTWEAGAGHEPVLGSPRVARRERLDQLAPLLVEGLELGGEHGGVAPAGPVQRGDPEHVAGDGEPAVLCREDQRKAAPQPAEPGQPVLLVQLERRLEVRSGTEPLGSQLTADLAVVVDLAVSDQPDALGVPTQGLGTGVRVGDREVSGAQPGLPHPPGLRAVRSAVGHPLEHAVSHVGIERSVRCHDG